MNDAGVEVAYVLLSFVVSASRTTKPSPGVPLRINAPYRSSTGFGDRAPRPRLRLAPTTSVVLPVKLLIIVLLAKSRSLGR